MVVRLVFVVYVFFASCVEISAMEALSKAPVAHEYSKEARDELEEILKIEQDFPGFFAKLIVDSLRAECDSIHPFYFGIQSSSNARGWAKYTRSLELDFKDLNQGYDREEKEEKGKLSIKKLLKRFQQQKASLEPANNDVKSTLKSDIAKSEFVPSDLPSFAIIDINTSLDMNRSIYEALRETYKSKKTTPAVPKIFSLQELAGNSFEKLKSKQDQHLLEKIIVNNFEGFILQEYK